MDCIITDPPYSGLRNKSRGSRFRQTENLIHYDDLSERAFRIVMKPICCELYRLCRIGGHFYCFTDWMQLRNMIDCIELASFKLVNVICWDKVHFGTGRGYRSQSEYIVLFSKGLPNSFHLTNVGNVISVKRIYKKRHPHEKPIDLLKILIRNSTNEGDVILDPFLGSGSTAVAAKLLGRKYIGIELKKEFIAVAESRLRDVA